MESNSTTKCGQDPHPLPIRKVCFSTFLDSVLDFFLFCNATGAHSYLKSRYFLPFLNPRNDRRAWQKQKSSKQSFFPHGEDWLPREDCIKPHIFRVSPLSNSSFFDLIPDFSFEGSLAPSFPKKRTIRKSAKVIMDKFDGFHFLGDYYKIDLHKQVIFSVSVG